MNTRHILFIFITLLCLSACKEEKWIPIYTGEEYLSFKHYLGIPDASIKGLALPQDSLGNYTSGLGYEDPLEVFSISQEGEEYLIRISGQVIGGLILRDSLSDYHLKLQFKWGDIKWDWMEGRPKDGGILYHQGKGPIRHELQIHEGDVGSYWARQLKLDIPSRLTSDLPQAIQVARPYLAPYVTTLRDTMRVFDPEAEVHQFEGKDEWQIVIASPYNEYPSGAWNTLEVICWKNHAVHLVNGKINLVLLNAQYRKDDVWMPLTFGRLTLQSEGAEIFFREIYYRELDEIPGELAGYLEK